VRRGVSQGAFDPLPSTEAVINCARSAARIGPLHYTACSGLLESTGSNTGRALNFYETIGKNFDEKKTGFVEPLLQHVRMDQEYEHGSICEHVLSEFQVLDIETANAVLDVTERFKDILMFWFDDIYRAYVAAPPSSVGAIGKRNFYRRSATGFGD
jgi:hypothetical protein